MDTRIVYTLTIFATIIWWIADFSRIAMCGFDDGKGLPLKPINGMTGTLFIIPGVFTTLVVLQTYNYVQYLQKEEERRQ